MTRPANAVDFDSAAAILDAAANPIDLFGPIAADGNLTGAIHRYRRLARLVHPDVAPDAARAHALFARLSQLYAQFTTATTTRVTVRTGRGTVSVGPLLAQGDIANVYAADHAHPRRGSGAPTGVPTATVPAVWKVTRDPRHNDLIEAEAHALGRIASHGDPRFAPYLPQLLDAFTHRQADTGIHRRTTVLQRIDGFVSFAQLLDTFPGGLDPRDAAWMWRRLLVAIGTAHRAGIVHGAVVPEHVFVEPDEHGLVLVDWCYAVDTACYPGAPITAVVTARRMLYPSEVFAKQSATAATDIYLASRLMALLMGQRTPKPMQAFIAGCTRTNPAGRPSDAWALLEELDELLHRMYGPRRFRPFHLPADLPRSGHSVPATTTTATGDPGTAHQKED
ncbi:MAG TPA: molecular chaperone DnaJ [Actinomycetes bacterium]|nr:molecular chaperone DnaJ [Actinomycetes bacterium]